MPRTLLAPQNDVQLFYKERVETQDGSSLTATALYEDYSEWCEEVRKEPLALPTFGREFGELGVQKAKIAGRVRYIGIGLKSGMAYLPVLKPAAIEPELRDGRLVLSPGSLHGDLEKVDLDAALQGLKITLARLAEDAQQEANSVDRRVVAHLRRLAFDIPERTPRQHELFAIAHELEGLQRYGNTVTAEWPELLAAQYHGMTLAFDATVRQFPKWRDFKRNALKEALSAQQIALATVGVGAVAQELRAGDASAFVDEDLPKVFDKLSKQLSDNRLTPIEHGQDELARDAIEGLNNALKLIARAALACHHALAPERASVSKLMGGARKHINKQVASSDKALADFAIKWLKRFATRIIPSGTVGVLLAKTLATTFPESFGWLVAILRFLGLG